MKKKVMRVSGFIKSDKLNRQDKIRLYNIGLTSYKKYYKSNIDTSQQMRDRYTKYENEQKRDKARVKRMKKYKESGDIEKYQKAKNAHKRYYNYMEKEYEHMLHENSGSIKINKTKDGFKFSRLKDVNIDRVRPAKYHWDYMTNQQKLKVLREAGVIDNQNNILFDPRYGDWKRRIMEYIDIDDEEKLINFLLYNV